jgi:hypothetical protein
VSVILVRVKISNILLLATSLMGRFRQAADSLEQADNYFKELSSSVGADNIVKWTKEIVDAEKRRFQSPDAMDIMGTRNVAANINDIPSAAETEKNSFAEVWILLALAVEEKQCVICFVKETINSLERKN